MTYEERLFAEAEIVLQRYCCRMGPCTNGRLPIDFSGNADLSMDVNGTIYIEALHVPYEDIADSIGAIRRVGHNMAEYMKAMENAPDLKAGGLPDGYKLLAEYADTVFAGHRTRFGMEFVTWKRGADGSLYCGDYFGGNYTGAKPDFAQRSELAEKSRFFDHEQLAELYRLCEQERSSRYLPDSRDRLLYRIQSQILETDPSAAEMPEPGETQTDDWYDGETPESVDIYIEDLTPRMQKELLRLMGDNCNFDIYPVASIPIEQTEEPELTM